MTKNYFTRTSSLPHSSHLQAKAVSILSDEQNFFEFPDPQLERDLNNLFTRDQARAKIKTYKQSSNPEVVRMARDIEYRALMATDKYQARLADTIAAQKLQEDRVAKMYQSTLNDRKELHQKHISSQAYWDNTAPQPGDEYLSRAQLAEEQKKREKIVETAQAIQKRDIEERYWAEQRRKENAAKWAQGHTADSFQRVESGTKKKEPTFADLAIKPYADLDKEKWSKDWSEADRARLTKEKQRLQGYTNVIGGTDPVAAALGIAQVNAAYKRGEIPHDVLQRLHNAVQAVIHKTADKAATIDSLQKNAANVALNANTKPADSSLLTSRAQRLQTMRASQGTTDVFLQDMAQRMGISLSSLQEALKNPNDQQLRIIASPQDVVSTVGGPGTGKSYAATARSVYQNMLYQENPTPETNVQTSAFWSPTTAGAANQVKILKGLSKQGMLPGVKVEEIQPQTIYSAAAKMIMKKNFDRNENDLPTKSGLQMLGMGDYEFMGTKTQAPTNFAENSKMKPGEEAHDFLQKMLKQYSITGQNVKQLAMDIHTTKSTMLHSDDYTDKMNEGRKQFNTGNLNHPAALLYLYEQTRTMAAKSIVNAGTPQERVTSHFGLPGQTSPKLDFMDTLRLTHDVARLPGASNLKQSSVYLDEAQDMPPVGMFALAAMTHDNAHITISQDASQQVISNNVDTAQVAEDVFGKEGYNRSFRSVVLDATYRLNRQNAALVNSLRNQPEQAGRPQAPSMIAVGPNNRRVKPEDFPTFHYADTQAEMHHQMIDNWFKRMETTPQQVAGRIAKGEEAFKGTPIAPAQHPFVFMMHEQEESFKKGLQGYLQEQMGGNREHGDALMKAIYTNQPISAETQGKMHGQMMSAIRGGTVTDASVNISRNGMWDVADYQSQLYTMLSRATNQNFLYGSAEGVGRTKHDNSPDVYRGTKMPKGSLAIMRGLIENGINQQGLYPGQFPQIWQSIAREYQLKKQQKRQPIDADAVHEMTNFVVNTIKHNFAQAQIDMTSSMHQGADIGMEFDRNENQAQIDMSSSMHQDIGKEFDRSNNLVNEDGERISGVQISSLTPAGIEGKKDPIIDARKIALAHENLNNIMINGPKMLQTVQGKLGSSRTVQNLLNNPVFTFLRRRMTLKEGGQGQPLQFPDAAQMLSGRNYDPHDPAFRNGQTFGRTRSLTEAEKLEHGEGFNTPIFEGHDEPNMYARPVGDEIKDRHAKGIITDEEDKSPMPDGWHIQRLALKNILKDPAIRKHLLSPHGGFTHKELTEFRSNVDHNLIKGRPSYRPFSQLLPRVPQSLVTHSAMPQIPLNIPGMKWSPKGQYQHSILERLLADKQVSARIHAQQQGEDASQDPGSERMVETARMKTLRNLAMKAGKAGNTQVEQYYKKKYAEEAHGVPQTSNAQGKGMKILKAFLSNPDVQKHPRIKSMMKDQLLDKTIQAMIRDIPGVIDPEGKAFGLAQKAKDLAAKKDLALPATPGFIDLGKGLRDLLKQEHVGTLQKQSDELYKQAPNIREQNVLRAGSSGNKDLQDQLTKQLMNLIAIDANKNPETMRDIMTVAQSFPQDMPVKHTGTVASMMSDLSAIYNPHANEQDKEGYIPPTTITSEEMKALEKSNPLEALMVQKTLGQKGQGYPNEGVRPTVPPIEETRGWMKPGSPQRLKQQEAIDAQKKYDAELAFPGSVEYGAHTKGMMHYLKTNEPDRYMEILKAQGLDQYKAVQSSRNMVEKYVNLPETLIASMGARGNAFGITPAQSHAASAGVYAHKNINSIQRGMDIESDAIGATPGGFLDPMALSHREYEDGTTSSTLEGKSVTPEQYQRRLENMLHLDAIRKQKDPEYKGLRPYHKELIQTHLSTIKELRNRFNDPEYQEQAAHQLNMMAQVALGKHLLKGEEGQPGDPIGKFFAPQRDVFGPHQRSLEGIVRYANALHTAMSHTQRTGTIKREHLDELMASMGHEPGSKIMEGLPLLERQGMFKNPEDTISLQELAHQFLDKGGKDPLTQVQHKLSDFTPYPIHLGEAAVFVSPETHGPQQAGRVQQNMEGIIGKFPMFNPSQIAALAGPYIKGETRHTGVVPTSYSAIKGMRYHKLGDVADRGVLAGRGLNLLSKAEGEEVTRLNYPLLSKEEKEKLKDRQPYIGNMPLNTPAGVPLIFKMGEQEVPVLTSHILPKHIADRLAQEENNGGGELTLTPPHSRVSAIRHAEILEFLHGQTKKYIQNYVKPRRPVFQQGPRRINKQFVSDDQKRARQVIAQHRSQILSPQRMTEVMKTINQKMRGSGRIQSTRKQFQTLRQSRRLATKSRNAEPPAETLRGLFSLARGENQSKPLPQSLQTTQKLGSLLQNIVQFHHTSQAINTPTQIHSLPPAIDQGPTPDDLEKMERLNAQIEAISQRRANHQAKGSQQPPPLGTSTGTSPDPTTMSGGNAGSPPPPPPSPPPSPPPPPPPPPSSHAPSSSFSYDDEDRQVTTTEHLTALGKWLRTGNPYQGIPVPSKEQLGFIDDPDWHHAIEGGPGGGKTATLMRGVMAGVTSQQFLPSEVDMFSAQHSGASALEQSYSSKIGPAGEKYPGYQGLLPDEQPYKFNAPRTFHALANQVLSYNAGSDARGNPVYPNLQYLGLGHLTGRIRSDPTEEELDLMTPEAQEIAKANSLTSMMRNAFKQRGVSRTEPQLADEMKNIGDFKRERNLPDGGRYADKLALGKLHLQDPNMPMTHEAALALHEEGLRVKGDMDFEDQLHYGAMGLEKLPSHMLPPDIFSRKAVVVDEFQDMSHGTMNLFQHYLRRIQSVNDLQGNPNTPHVYTGMDRAQVSMSNMGGLSQRNIPSYLKSLLGLGQIHQLEENFRSDAGSVALNNAILMQPDIINDPRSALQVPHNKGIGKNINFELSKTQPHLMRTMFGNMLGNAGLSLPQIAANVKSGRHALEGIDFEDKTRKGVLPSQSPAILSTRKKQALFEYEAKGMLMAHGLSKDQAEVARKQLFRRSIPGSRNTTQEKIDARTQFPLLRTGGSRSFEFSHPQVDATRVEGWLRSGDDATKGYLHNLFTGVSRVSRGGQLSVYAASHPFSNMQQEAYMIKGPGSLDESGGTPRLQTAQGFQDIEPNRLNKFESYGGKDVPQGFPGILRARDKQLEAWGLKPPSTPVARPVPPPRPVARPVPPPRPVAQPAPARITQAQATPPPQALQQQAVAAALPDMSKIPQVPQLMGMTQARIDALTQPIAPVAPPSLPAIVSGSSMPPEPADMDAQLSSAGSYAPGIGQNAVTPVMAKQISQYVGSALAQSASGGMGGGNTLARAPLAAPSTHQQFGGGKGLTWASNVNMVRSTPEYDKYVSPTDVEEARSKVWSHFQNGSAHVTDRMLAIIKNTPYPAKYHDPEVKHITDLEARARSQYNIYRKDPKSRRNENTGMEALYAHTALQYHQVQSGHAISETPPSLLPYQDVMEHYRPEYKKIRDQIQSGASGIQHNAKAKQHQPHNQAPKIVTVPLPQQIAQGSTGQDLLDSHLKVGELKEAHKASYAAFLKDPTPENDKLAKNDWVQLQKASQDHKDLLSHIKNAPPPFVPKPRTQTQMEKLAKLATGYATQMNAFHEQNIKNLPGLPEAGVQAVFDKSYTAFQKDQVPHKGFQASLDFAALQMKQGKTGNAFPIGLAPHGQALAAASPDFKNMLEGKPLDIQVKNANITVATANTVAIGTPGTTYTPLAKRVAGTPFVPATPADHPAARSQAIGQEIRNAQPFNAGLQNGPDDQKAISGNISGGGHQYGPNGGGGSGQSGQTGGMTAGRIEQMGHNIARIGSELQFLGQTATAVVDKAIQQASDYRLATVPLGVGGASGTSGFFNFMPSAQGGINDYSHANLPMYSNVKVAQGIQSLTSMTNTPFNQSMMTGNQSPLTNMMGLAAMTGMDPTQLMAQMTSITGTMGQGSKGNLQNTGMLTGMMQQLYGKNLSADNVAPTLNAVQSILPTLQGLQPNAKGTLGQVAGFLQLGLNSGMTANNMGQVTDAMGSLAQAGSSPNTMQQAALARLYPGQTTASPGLAEFNTQQTSGAIDLARNQLMQNIGGGLSLPNLQIQVSQANIRMDQAQLSMSQGQLTMGYAQQAQSQLQQNQSQRQQNQAELQQKQSQLQQDQAVQQQAQSQLQQNYNVASFANQQSIANQQYGKIGQDTSRTAYFSWMRSQNGAAYSGTSPELANQFRAAPTFGLQNAQFYAGIEHQRTQLTLARSPLMSDMAYQENMKYLNKQEAFYAAQLKLTNQQRSFDQVWQPKLLDGNQKLITGNLKIIAGNQQLIAGNEGILAGNQELITGNQKLIDIQGNLLGLQANSVGIQADQLTLAEKQAIYDQKNAAITQKYLAQQGADIAALLAQNAQSVGGQGPVGGVNVTPKSIIEKMASANMNDADLHQMITQLGVPTNQIDVVQQLVRQLQKAAPSGLQADQDKVFNDPANKTVNALLKQLQDSGAFTSQTQAAASSNASLNFAGIDGDFRTLVNSVNDLNSTMENLNSFFSKISPAFLLFGTVATGLGTALMGIASILNIIGVVGGIGGAGAAAGGAGAVAGGAAAVAGGAGVAGTGVAAAGAAGGIGVAGIASIAAIVAGLGIWGYADSNKKPADTSTPIAAFWDSFLNSIPFYQQGKNIGQVQHLVQGDSANQDNQNMWNDFWKKFGLGPAADADKKKQIDDAKKVQDKHIQDQKNLPKGPSIDATHPNAGAHSGGDHTAMQQKIAYDKAQQDSLIKMQKAIAIDTSTRDKANIAAKAKMDKDNGIALATLQKEDDAAWMTRQKNDAAALALREKKDAGANDAQRAANLKEYKATLLKDAKVWQDTTTSGGNQYTKSLAVNKGTYDASVKENGIIFQQSVNDEKAANSTQRIENATLYKQNINDDATNIKNNAKNQATNQAGWEGIFSDWNKKLIPPIIDFFTKGIPDFFTKTIPKLFHDAIDNVFKNMTSGAAGGNPLAALLKMMTGGGAQTGVAAGGHPGFTTTGINKDFHAMMSYGVHQGVDFAADQGTPLREFAPKGEVVNTGFYPWGGEVDVDVGGGLIERYLHLSLIAASIGQKLKQGDFLGLTGGGTVASGLGAWSSGAHSHVQYDFGNINAGVNPWDVWAMFNDFNLAQFYGYKTGGAGGAGGRGQNNGKNIGLQHKLADGGVAMTHTRAIIGEREPEAVIPISKLASLLQTTFNRSTTSSVASATTTTTSGKSVAFAKIAEKIELHVHTTSSTLDEQAQDSLMAQLLGIFNDALKEYNGKLV